MYISKIIQFEDLCAVVIPDEMMDEMNLKQGDQFFIDCKGGVISLNLCDEEELKQLETARRIMRDDYDVLKRLAESE